MDAVVLGNVALDIICRTIDEVPRYESIVFDQAAIAPGGCGSNVAVGLRALGVSTALVACTGSDITAELAVQYWRSIGLDLRFLRQIEGYPSGVSIGLVDTQSQLRFIHTPGANRQLSAGMLNLLALAKGGAKMLHVAGFFVLPGLEDGQLPGALNEAQKLGLRTSLDVVESPGMSHPEVLWPCLPFLDVLFCNAVEAQRLTKAADVDQAALRLLARGASTVVIKLGHEGCRIFQRSDSIHVPGELVENVVDTTGAGDAFDAGFLTALLHGESLASAGRAGNKAGSQMLSVLGATQGWDLAR